jgi:hypothetical protein
MQPGQARAIAQRSKSIAGWFTPDAAELFGFLDCIQRTLHVQGDLFEIGVHHGKSAVVLAAMARPEETVAVCDIFGDQGENISRSGRGDRDVFLDNLRTYANAFSRTKIFHKLSTELTAAEIGDPYRVFHVDGGHSAEEALFDIILGTDVLAGQGAIIVDDPFRIEWPGVTEAILRFLNERPDIVPLALGFNKMVLVRREAHAPYTDAIASGAVWRYIPSDIYDLKMMPVAGHQTAIFYVPTHRQIPELGVMVARGRSSWSSAARQISRLRRPPNE